MSSCGPTTGRVGNWGSRCWIAHAPSKVKRRAARNASAVVFGRSRARLAGAQRSRRDLSAAGRGKDLETIVGIGHVCQRVVRVGHGGLQLRERPLHGSAPGSWAHERNRRLQSGRWRAQRHQVAAARAYTGAKPVDDCVRTPCCERYPLPLITFPGLVLSDLARRHGLGNRTLQHR
jgi:hypothetical protein